MSSIRMKRGVVAAVTGLGLAAAPLAIAPATADDTEAPRTTTAQKAAESNTTSLQLLAINDFHGQLEVIPASASSSGRVGSTPAGGGAYLATHLEQLRTQAEERGAESLTVAAGDLIGATPLLSAAFHDEPTIEAMNLMGLQVSSVGNHEFDEGWRELVRMQEGGCIEDGDGADNQNSCPDGDFEGADFDYLSANVKHADTGDTVLPPYSIQTVGGKKVGFIGMTLEDTPNIVTKSGIEGLEFTDEVETANALVPVLRKQGVRAIVVLLHEGGQPTALDVNGCANVAGPGIEIAKALDPEIDAVVSGHTHQPYICTVTDPAGQPRLITSAFSVGRVVTEINLAINRHGQVKRDQTVATNHVVTNSDGTQSDAAIAALIQRYKVLVEPIANEVLGQVAAASSVSRSAEANGRDSLLGNLIADAQRVDPSVVPAGGSTPVVAFMNPGGIRADLLENSAGDITYGAAFSTQPFNNYDTSFDMSGQQILDVLNQQWNGRNEANPAPKPGEDPTATFKVLQVSGLKYTWDRSLAAQTGTNALVGDVLIDLDPTEAGEDWQPVDPTASYRVTANNFLADGGDGFSTFGTIPNKYFGGLDIDALANYLKANNPYELTPLDRISTVNISTP